MLHSTQPAVMEGSTSAWPSARSRRQGPPDPLGSATIPWLTSPFMNYLAHLHLAAHTHSSLTGNLLGISSGRPAEHTRHRTRRGDLAAPQDRCLHRQSPRTQGRGGLFRGPWRRFGGILVDMLYDHWLSLHWPQFHNEALPVSCSRVTGTCWWMQTACRMGCRCPSDGWRSRTGSPPISTRGAGTGPQRHRPPAAPPLPLGDALLTLKQAQWQGCEAGFCASTPADEPQRATAGPLSRDWRPRRLAAIKRPRAGPSTNASSGPWRGRQEGERLGRHKLVRRFPA